MKIMIMYTLLLLRRCWGEVYNLILFFNFNVMFLFQLITCVDKITLTSTRDSLESFYRVNADLAVLGVSREAPHICILTVFFFNY